jgi:hypothetical protein
VVEWYVAPAGRMVVSGTPSLNAVDNVKTLKVEPTGEGAFA